MTGTEDTATAVAPSAHDNGEEEPDAETRLQRVRDAALNAAGLVDEILSISDLLTAVGEAKDGFGDHGRGLGWLGAQLSETAKLARAEIDQVFRQVNRAGAGR